MNRPGTSLRIKVDQAELRGEVAGVGDPLVVLHGGPGIGYSYLAPELSTLLAPHARLIFYDQRASGQSTGSAVPELLAFEQYLEDLDAVLATLEISRAHLLGHSFGALLALNFALRHPDRIAGMILVDGDPASKALWSKFTESLQQRQNSEALAELASIQANEGWQGQPSLVARYFELALAPFFADCKPPQGFGARFATTPPENLFGTGGKVRDSLGEWDIHSQLPRIHHPTLLITGDQSIYPAESFARMEQGLPRAQLVMLNNVSHFPFIEAPCAFQSAVLDFVERNSSTLAL